MERLNTRGRVTGAAKLLLCEFSLDLTVAVRLKDVTVVAERA